MEVWKTGSLETRNLATADVRKFWGFEVGKVGGLGVWKCEKLNGRDFEISEARKTGTLGAWKLGDFGVWGTCKGCGMLGGPGALGGTPIDVGWKHTPGF